MPALVLKDNNYWKNYVHNTNVNEIEKKIKKTTFKSRGLNLNLTYFEKSKNAPNILYIPGTGCYGLYYAELLYNMHLRGYNVFVLDFQGHGASEGERGDFAVNEILENCDDAVSHISKNFNNKIGVCGGSFGGFITFYLGLSCKKVKSILCQNPAILTDTEFQENVTKKAKTLLPLIKFLGKIFPKIKIPTSIYIDKDSFSQTSREKSDSEKFEKDPNTIKQYTIRALISQISTPPPDSVEKLKIPTMFLVPSKDSLMPASYVKNLYNRLPRVKKKIFEVNGGHLWMYSHPKDAAKIICDWFDKTL